jgi:octaprenyl-diphosphate synthase
VSQAASRGIQSGHNEGEGASSTVDSDRAFDLKAVYAPICRDLESVETILRKELSSQTPFVDQLLEHSWLLGGKRIRPAFLLLSAACCGKVEQPHFQMAAALEMIHTATLIHDDILDEAKTRRHQATANSLWGNKISVLLGDYLFTHAFHVASLAESTQALRLLAQASNRVCEGEMRQNNWQGDFDLSEESYLRMISEKTAELCQVGCRLGALLSGAESELVESFATYGRNLGVAFQIIDDVLDVVGQPDEVGKTLGTDLVNQKPTLPVIHCLEHLGNESRAELRKILVDPTATTEVIIPFLAKTQSLDYARGVARDHAQSAMDFTDLLDANEYSASLRLLAEFVLQRTH